MDRRPLYCLLLAVGCAVRPAADTDESSTSTSETSDSAPTTGPCDTDGCLPEPFGFTCMRLAVGEGVEGDPFAGTDKVVVTMYYEPCLIDYYTEKHPEMRLDGPADKGGQVFAAWKTRLCEEEVEGRIDCSVDSFEQTLQDGGVTPIYNMTVTYRTPNPGQLDGGMLLWGPGPVTEYADCDDGGYPFVRLTGLSDVVGLDAFGEPLWSLQSYGPTPRGLIDDVAAGCLLLPITD